MASAACAAGDPTASPKHSNGHASPLDLIRRFYKLQTARVEGYGLFEEEDPVRMRRHIHPYNSIRCAFNTFIAGAPLYDFNVYKQRVAEITVSFKKISEEIIHIKNSLRDTHNKGDISAIIEKIQELEESKLKCTADLQIARKDASDDPNNEAVQQEISAFHLKLDDLAQEINDALEDLKFESEELYAQEIEDETSR